MNISFFLTPKTEVAYLYDTYTLRQGIEKMRHYGYTAIPVLSEDSRYLGTVSEGDFLWAIVDFEEAHMAKETLYKLDPRELEALRVSDLDFCRQYPSVRIETSMEDLLQRAAMQNFVPVVDDREVFIGIITRKDIITYFAGKWNLERNKL